VSNSIRATLISSGEHIAAVCKLGDNYTAEEYLEAVDLARTAGAGESYADACLGVDVDSVLRGVAEDDGEAIVRAAEASLRRRGIDPSTATYSEFASALAEAAS
jgi:hypothetical protein